MAGGRGTACVPVELSVDGSTADTLRFDGAGRAELWLPVGTWRYRLEGGTQGLVAVEQYSDELLPARRSSPRKPGRR